MSNEELALLIQGGDNSYLTELWEQTKRFFLSVSFRFYNKYKERCTSAGVVLNDLEQECYIILCEAVRAFDSSTGYKLLTYANYPLKNRFFELIGMRTDKNKALNDSVSVDMLLPGTEDLTVKDMLPDETAEESFKNVDDEIFNNELHNALEEAMQTLKPREQEALKRMYYNGEQQNNISADWGCSDEHVRQTRHKALRKLRQPQNRTILEPYANELITARAYHNTGLNSFKNSGLSSVENTVEFIEKLIKQIQ